MYLFIEYVHGAFPFKFHEAHDRAFKKIKRPAGIVFISLLFFSKKKNPVFMIDSSLLSAQLPLLTSQKVGNWKGFSHIFIKA